MTRQPDITPGERLRIECRRKYGTQNKAATVLKIHRNTLAGIITGRINPNADEKLAIQVAFGINKNDWGK